MLLKLTCYLQTGRNNFFNIVVPLKFSVQSLPRDALSGRSNVLNDMSDSSLDELSSEEESSTSNVNGNEVGGEVSVRN